MERQYQLEPRRGRGAAPFPATLPGCFFAYKVDLNNIISQENSLAPGRIPCIQSMYADNSANPHDVICMISETNVEFIIPGFSTGIYPIICGKHPTLTFVAIDNAEGPTVIDLFAQQLPPYISKQLPSGAGAARFSTVHQVNPAPIYCQFAPGDPSLNAWQGITSSITAIKRIAEINTFGRIYLKSLTYYVNVGFNAAGNLPVIGVDFALHECLSLGTQGWLYNPIIIPHILMDRAQGSSNGWLNMPPVTINFDPPYIGKYAVGNELLGQTGYNFPCLGWACGDTSNFAQSVVGVQFVTFCQFGTIPRGNATVSGY